MKEEEEKLKRCCRCKLEQPIFLFGKNRSKSDGYQSQCRDCRNIVNNEHYRNSEVRRETVKRNGRKSKGTKRERVKEVKDSAFCPFCGESENCALDFHHIDPSTKLFSISRQLHSINNGGLEAEMAKCVILCANCHRKVHNGIITLENTTSNFKQ